MYSLSSAQYSDLFASSVRTKECTIGVGHSIEVQVTL